MQRDNQVCTMVTEDEKQTLRVEAAKRKMSMSELNRHILYDWLESNGFDTSRVDEGNGKTAGMATAD